MPKELISQNIKGQKSIFILNCGQKSIKMLWFWPSNKKQFYSLIL